MQTSRDPITFFVEKIYGSIFSAGTHREHARGRLGSRLKFRSNAYMDASAHRNWHGEQANPKEREPRRRVSARARPIRRASCPVDAHDSAHLSILMDALAQATMTIAPATTNTI